MGAVINNLKKKQQYQQNREDNRFITTFTAAATTTTTTKFNSKTNFYLTNLTLRFINEKKVDKLRNFKTILLNVCPHDDNKDKSNKRD